MDNTKSWFLTSQIAMHRKNKRTLWHCLDKRTVLEDGKIQYETACGHIYYPIPFREDLVETPFDAPRCRVCESVLGLREWHKH